MHVERELESFKERDLRDGCYCGRGLYQLFMHNNTLNTLLKKIATGYEVVFKTALYKMC